MDLKRRIFEYIFKSIQLENEMFMEGEAHDIAKQPSTFIKTLKY